MYWCDSWPAGWHTTQHMDTAFRRWRVDTVTQHMDIAFRRWWGWNNTVHPSLAQTTNKDFEMHSSCVRSVMYNA
jgi:hypothetical protein